MNSIMREGLNIQKKVSLTNLYFNRFLAIRYTTAFFLFLNLYWAIFLIGSLSFAAILPLFLFILSLFTALEQVKLYRCHSNKLPYAYFFYRVLVVSCIILLITLYSRLYNDFYPFLKNTHDVLNILTVLLIFSLSISFLMLKKLNKIKLDQDKHFKRIQAYEEIIN
ncbi:hypothetical protein RHO14_07690 [Orbus wheelerorum]|uniref:hypothetical protein n=1 Tax=Orbus wheelerorum TaxID=3074111 RepID=UPI00370D7167